MTRTRNRNAEIKVVLTVGDIETILRHLEGLTGHPQSVCDRLCNQLYESDPALHRENVKGAGEGLT